MITLVYTHIRDSHPKEKDMNKLLIFTGGIATGAIASYFVTKHVLTEKINQEVAMEFREMYENPLEPDEEFVKVEDVVVHRTEDTVKEEDRTEDDYKDYSNITNKELVEKPDIVIIDEDELFEEEDIDLDLNAEPYFLDESEFLSAYINEKVSLIWWDDSDILSDEKYNILDPMMFGHALKPLYDQTDILYVRDDRVGIDYSIIYHDGDFFDEADAE